ncbi:unnamed protein product, partial [Amaranthus hypochondriacus]
MVSEQYDSGDRKTAGDGVRPENTEVTDLDVFFGSFGTEISPLKMCKKAVQEDVIHSFKPTSTKEIYEKLEKGVCEFCDEQLEETELAGHDCSHKEYSMLILHQGMRDKLMVIVYHETTKVEESEEGQHIPDLKSNNLEENTQSKESKKSTELQNKEEYRVVEKKQKKMSRSGMCMIP